MSTSMQLQEYSDKEVDTFFRFSDPAHAAALLGIEVEEAEKLFVLIQHNLEHPGTSHIQACEESMYGRSYHKVPNDLVVVPTDRPASLALFVLWDLS